MLRYLFTFLIVLTSSYGHDNDCFIHITTEEVGKEISFFLMLSCE